MAGKTAPKFKVGDVVEKREYRSVHTRGVVTGNSGTRYWVVCFDFLQTHPTHRITYKEEDLRCCRGVIRRAYGKTQYCRHCRHHSVCSLVPRQDCNQCEDRFICFTERGY